MFVKTLSSGATQRISTDGAGAQANDGSYDPMWSPDGTMIAFWSYASNLVPTGYSGSSQVFLKTLSTGAVQRISVDAGGATANSESGGHSWSPTGTFVVFHSDASSLVPGDTNGARDVFVKAIP